MSEGTNVDDVMRRALAMVDEIVEQQANRTAAEHMSESLQSAMAATATLGPAIQAFARASTLVGERLVELQEALASGGIQPYQLDLGMAPGLTLPVLVEVLREEYMFVPYCTTCHKQVAVIQYDVVLTGESPNETYLRATHWPCADVSVIGGAEWFVSVFDNPAEPGRQEEAFTCSRKPPRYPELRLARVDWFMTDDPVGAHQEHEREVRLIQQTLLRSFPHYVRIVDAMPPDEGARNRRPHEYRSEFEVKDSVFVAQFLAATAAARDHRARHPF